MGYTLIELLVVITIASLMVFAVVQNSHKTYEHVGDNVIADQLKDVVRFAQLESNIRHDVIGLCPSSGHECSAVWRGELLVFTDSTDDGVIHDRHQIIRVVTFKNDKDILHWRTYPNYRRYLQFSPDRLTANDNGTLWYCHRGAASPAFAMTVARSGMVNITKPDKAGRVRDSEGQILVC